MACKHLEDESYLSRPTHCLAGEDIGETEELDAGLVYGYGCTRKGVHFGLWCPRYVDRAGRDRLKIEDKSKT